MANHEEIRIESNLYWSAYLVEVALKYLGKNGIKTARKYNMELKDIRIGHNSIIPAMPVLILLLQVIKPNSHFMLTFVPMWRLLYIYTSVQWRMAYLLCPGDISRTIHIPLPTARTV